MDGVHDRRDVDGDGAEVFVGEVGEVSLSGRRVVALVHLPRGADLVHEKAGVVVVGWREYWCAGYPAAMLWIRARRAGVRWEGCPSISVSLEPRIALGL